jgi:hypothetical protein
VGVIPRLLEQPFLSLDHAPVVEAFSMHGEPPATGALGIEVIFIQ